MSLEYELKTLEEVAKMATMNQRQMSEEYDVPIDMVDKYFRINVKAKVDVIIDNLRRREEIRKAKAAEEDANYKGVAEGDIPQRYF